MQNCFSFVAVALVCVAALFPKTALAQLIPGEAVCGYGRRYSAVEANSVKQGLSVQLLAGDVEASRPAPLRFRVGQLPQGTPVDDLQVEHEKLMHVIGVREDLGAFFHIHPQRAAPGLWEIVCAFTNAGRYQIWSDIKHRGTVYSFAHPRFTVAGETPATPRGPVPQWRDRKGGYEISLKSVEPTLVVGRKNSFEAIIRDESGNQVGTEFFLGALMHFVIVKDDLTIYRHAHAKEHWKSGRTVTFEHVFAQPGLYKIFAQFRPAKTRLPPDEAILAEFWVRVDAR